MFVNAQDLAEPLTYWAGPQGIIKAEHHVGRLDEGKSIGLEFLGELLCLHLLLQKEAQRATALSLEESGLHRVCQTAAESGIGRHGQAIDHQLNRVGEQLLAGQYL